MDTTTVIGTRLDYWVIIGYFILIFSFGFFFARFTRSTKDFFFGGQRFSWWLITFSCVASVVGSYSFIKYSAAGFRYGLSSTMAYTNDWIVMSFLLLGWLPIIYFNRVGSVPEYFRRRFDQRTGIVATVIILIYMIGYIGINLYTMGVALNAMLGTEVFLSAVVVAVICGIYVTAGGQTSVIMTDIFWPVVITPLAHGIDPSGGFKYMRALYGLTAGLVIAVVVTMRTRSKLSTGTMTVQYI